MSGEPMEIVFKDGAQPKYVYTPIPVPHHWKKQVKDDLDRDVRLGIIEKVPKGICLSGARGRCLHPKRTANPAEWSTFRT